MPATSYYELLEVPQDADSAVIRRAFMKLAQQWHPDKAPEGERETYENRFRRFSEAYEVLSDPVQRERYDRERIYRQRRPVTVEEPVWWSGATSATGVDEPWQRVRWEADPRETPFTPPFEAPFGARAVRQVHPLLGFSVVALLMALFTIAITIALTISGLGRLARGFRHARGR
ncbi:MAG: Chaperone protein DnaJ [bacterium]|nr:Chaperone protein DnaJ [bacterium]